VNMMNITTPLWTSAAAVDATQGVATQEWTAAGVSINTRTLQPGDLYIALQGPNVDGHDFVADAFEKGAVAACVSHRPPVLDPDAPLLVVDDTLCALQDLALAARVRTRAKVIAVTGSVGKTGVKDALKWVLERQGKTSASAGNLNNQWGLPLSLARVPASADFAVLEMGMNHAGELTPLSQMARPHVCMITTVQVAHTEFFDDIEQVADAKAEIFTGAEPGWTAVLNTDSPQFDRLVAGADAAVVTFGESLAADFRVLAYQLDPQGSTITAVTPRGRVSYRIASSGVHWVKNSLGVLAAVYALGGDVLRAAESLAELSPSKGRGQRFEISLPGGTMTLIDESYNASPAAMEAALAVLGAQPVTGAGSRIAVLGDMLELGVKTPQWHAELADAIVKSGIDLVFTAGQAMDHLWAVLPAHLQGHAAKTSDLLADAVKAAVQPGDVVMVKGSAGVRMGHVVATLLAMDETRRKEED